MLTSGGWQQWEPSVAVDQQNDRLSVRRHLNRSRDEPLGLELLVACAGGELVTLPAGSGAPTRTVQVERDLRDVLVDGTIVDSGGPALADRLEHEGYEPWRRQP
jgi:hypothetical protein